MDTLELELQKKWRRAIASDQSHLMFQNAAGELRKTDVDKLWKTTAECHYCTQPGTRQWEEGIGVVSDIAILEYLSALVLHQKLAQLPRFPVAGDRPGYFFDPCTFRAGVVNAGGPAAGLNVVNDSVTKRIYHLARICNCQPNSEKIYVFGYLGGFRGLAKDQKVRLYPSWDVKDRDHGSDPTKALITDDRALEPATFLKSSRFDLKKTSPEGKQINLEEVVAGVKRDRLQALFVAGGNGSQKAAAAIAAALDEEWKQGKLDHQVAVIGGPKTMDNDLLFCDTTFGFQTTVDHLVDAIATFHTTVSCLDRLGTMVVFGAASGFVALYAAYCSGQVDYVVIPEVVEKVGMWVLLKGQAEPCISEARHSGLKAALAKAGSGVTSDQVRETGIRVVMAHAAVVVATRMLKKQHALVVIAEGAKGEFEHRGGSAKKEAMSFTEMAKILGDAVNTPAIKKELMLDADDSVRGNMLEPQYLIREHSPRSYDIALCKFIGKSMADAALAGYTKCLVSRWCGQHALIPMELATALTGCVDPRDYFYRTMAARYVPELDQEEALRLWSRLSPAEGHSQHVI